MDRTLFTFGIVPNTSGHTPQRLANRYAAYVSFDPEPCYTLGAGVKGQYLWEGEDWADTRSILAHAEVHTDWKWEFSGGYYDGPHHVLSLGFTSLYWDPSTCSACYEDTHSTSVLDFLCSLIDDMLVWLSTCLAA